MMQLLAVNGTHVRMFFTSRVHRGVRQKLGHTLGLVLGEVVPKLLLSR